MTAPSLPGLRTKDVSRVDLLERQWRCLRRGSLGGLRSGRAKGNSLDLPRTFDNLSGALACPASRRRWRLDLDNPVINLCVNAPARKEDDFVGVEADELPVILAIDHLPAQTTRVRRTCREIDEGCDGAED